MLHWFVAAPALIAAPLPAQQNAVSPKCDVGPVAVSFRLVPAVPLLPSFGWSPEAAVQVLAIGHAATSPKKDAPDPDGRLPSTQPEYRDPAQALPECREEPVKRRKRKSDYPMA